MKQLVFFISRSFKEKTEFIKFHPCNHEFYKQEKKICNLVVHDIDVMIKNNLLHACKNTYKGNTVINVKMCL